MNIDVHSQLNSVDRSVSFIDRDDRDASTVTLSRTFATTFEDIWDADTMWERIDYFLVRVAPEANEYNVQMA